MAVTAAETVIMCLIILAKIFTIQVRTNARAKVVCSSALVLDCGSPISKGSTNNKNALLTSKIFLRSTMREIVHRSG